MRLRDRKEAISTTRAIDQTLESMICAGVTGITSRCSMVPCSRSRISAAPVRMMDNSVMWLMICTTEPNQALSRAGLKRARNARSTGWRVGAAVTLDELIDFAGEDLLYIATAGEGLAHAGGVDIELHGRRSPRQHVALEVGRNDQSEGVQPRVHARVHVPIVDHGRLA